ncbi:hypothetical protein HMI54_012562 [Coelomomyces lativittatus]|nr:hypothetical protein HMI56_003289 [Coelomomyces lativittatus]KAJ1517532.1 hypothetical protein HMI55_006795 [Coelomomyces lativittatus]KAJ1518678.1 hypothetical protein HMI54_012562 [Coelomomyces lativittatus]
MVPRENIKPEPQGNQQTNGGVTANAAHPPSEIENRVKSTFSENFKNLLTEIAGTSE